MTPDAGDATDDRAARTLRMLAPHIEAARTFSGWAFPQIRVHDLEPGPPWDYEAIVRERLADAHSVLDLGTGGAEFFAAAVADYAGRIVATEEWQVNAPIAADRLRPLGGHVVRASAERGLPFRDACFGLIIDRHEGAAMPEVARLLAPGGWFVTQQVARENWRELDAHFETRTQFPDHFRIYQDELRAAGLSVTAQRHEWKVAYGGLGDIAFMLIAAPWEIPDFDPAAQIEALIALEDDCQTERGLEMTFARYLITARKPA